MSSLFLNKDRSAVDREAFSSDSACFPIINSAVKAANLRNHKVSKENQRLEAAKEDRVPALSVSTSFKLSK
jgi:hypothetical protein